MKEQITRSQPCMSTHHNGCEGLAFVGDAANRLMPQECECYCHDHDVNCLVVREDGECTCCDSYTEDWE